MPPGAASPALLFGEPLPGTRRHGSEACDTGCGPLAWLEDLFEAGADSGSASLTPEAPGPVAETELTAAPAADASLRVPEVVGRIWIAPFVDADGIYREAHWVRVVLEPAGWKFP